MERTHHNGELNISNVGQEVILCGWVANKRNLGGIQFVDLRDNSGIIQCTILPEIKVPELKSEYCIQVFGTIAKKDVPNPALKTGEIEVKVSKINLINTSKLPPFIIADQSDALEETRLPYRYLDLRRPCLLNNLRIRAKAARIFREYFDEHGFLEVETPILNISTPEGARDYIVPSRLQHGHFYALPQSPQLWKQLLMVAGVEGYYQVARCFRDEDLRADRQPEFTHLDLEASFLDMDQLLTLIEGFIYRVFKETVGYEVSLPLRRIPFWEAMDTYGSDKPDTRFDLKLIDLKPLLKDSSFEGLKGEEETYVRAILVPGVAENTSRKDLDLLAVEARKFGLKGLFNLKKENGLISGGFAKFLSEESLTNLDKQLGMKDGDLLLFAASSSRRKADFGLGAIRSLYGKKLGLIKEGTYDLLWVVDFPMFDPIEGNPNVFTAEHHPFTRPRDEDLDKLDTNPADVYAYAYDIIINGYEAGGGSLRIYDQEVQKKIFKIIGLTPKQAQEKFGWFVDAFSYGTPPHGGLAFGFDRLCMILSGTENIRDVIAFPKNLRAVDPVSKTPTKVDNDQLKDVGIEVIKEE